jgi:hypothetical protein
MSEAWEIVEIVGTEEEAALIRGFLESQGVTVQIESLLFHQEPVNFGRLGEIRIRVPPEQSDEARKLLDDREDGTSRGLDEGELRGEAKDRVATDEREE